MKIKFKRAQMSWQMVVILLTLGTLILLLIFIPRVREAIFSGLSTIFKRLFHWG